jgi:hypothetical protein
MKKELCIEWREIGKTNWIYSEGTRGKSRGELNRLVNGFRQRNPLFEFRVYTYVRLFTEQSILLGGAK